jgi:hypothetical protein
VKHILIIAFLSLIYIIPAGASFQWGVNGHPNIQVGYCDIPITVQLDMVKAAGMTWYRSDWGENVIRKDPKSFDKLVYEAKLRGIQILPILIPSKGCRSDAAPEEIQKSSEDFARWAATRYKGKITHWELSNELDIFAMIRKGETDRNSKVWEWGDGDGNVPEQFEEVRYAKVRAELRGLNKGVKSVNPKALTIIDCAGWLHYGFFERLVNEDKVHFDILGWHWYSEMGDMTKVKGNFNVLEKLKSYGKPIWITEIDRRGGSMGGNEAEQASYMTGVAKQMMSYPGVKALFVYELFDEPYFGADNPESHFGMIETVMGDDGKWKPGKKKPVFDAMRKIIIED